MPERVDTAIAMDHAQNSAVGINTGNIFLAPIFIFIGDGKGVRDLTDNGEILTAMVEKLNEVLKANAGFFPEGGIARGQSAEPDISLEPKKCGTQSKKSRRKKDARATGRLRGGLGLRGTSFRPGLNASERIFRLIKRQNDIECPPVKNTLVW
jgi:hypothetical protein